MGGVRSVRLEDVRCARDGMNLHHDIFSGRVEGDICSGSR